MNHSHEPLIRIVKKPEISSQKALLLRFAAFLAAIIAGGIFIFAIGYNPFEVYKTMVAGCFRSKMAFRGMIKIAIPLLLTSLGVTLSFKMKFWNIGAEGQMIMGAVCATYFALYFSDLPHYLLLFICFIAGMIGGGIWGLIPAIFKSKFNTNETLFTLMLNYIALHIVNYLAKGPWRDPSMGGFPKIPDIPANATMDKILGIQAGWVIALIMVIVVFVYLNYTKQGYEISVVGESPATARYAGMNVTKILLLTMFLSGAISGMAGMLQVTGTNGVLTNGVAGGVGFTAIIVAWLSQLNPFIITLITIFFSILEKGGSVLQSAFGISPYAADILQGVILFFILACEFFVRYSFAVRKKGGKTA